MTQPAPHPRPAYPYRAPAAAFTQERGGETLGTVAIALLACLAGALAIVLLGGRPMSWPDPYTMAVMIAAFLFSLVVIIVTSRSREMQMAMQTMMLYFALFLTLPGYAHLMRDEYPFFSFRYPDVVVADAATMLLLFLVASVVGYGLARKLWPAVAPVPASSGVTMRPNLLLAAAMVVAAYLGTAVYVQTIGLDQVFRRRGEINLSEIETATLGLSAAVPQLLSLVTLVFSIAIWRMTSHRRAGLVLLLFSLVPFTFTLWPPGLPRSVLFGLMLFMSMFFVNYAVSSSRLALSGLYVFGAVVAMPVVDALNRRGVSLSVAEMFGQYVNSGDFDGLQSLNNAVVFTDAEGFTGGHQLLSALLFFVPRSIWVGKAEPTGSIAADVAGYKFFNVSMPLPGEFFVDFSWVGVAIGALAVGALLWVIDRYIGSHWSGDPKGRLVAGATVGYSIAIYRGTLLGVLAPIAVLTALIAVVNLWGFRPVRPRAGQPVPGAPGRLTPSRPPAGADGAPARG